MQHPNDRESGLLCAAAKKLTSTTQVCAVYIVGMCMRRYDGTLDGHSESPQSVHRRRALRFHRSQYYTHIYMHKYRILYDF